MKHLTRINWFMKKFYCSPFFIVALVSVVKLYGQKVDLKALFKDTPSQYKQMPFWHVNGKLTDEGIDSQMRDVKYKINFGSVTVLPVSPFVSALRFSNSVDSQNFQ
jgi:hypothetical protein